MITCYDNGGETLDRYTIVIDSDVYSMSFDPSASGGVNQWMGEIGDLLINDPGVKCSSLPLQVQKAVNEREIDALTSLLDQAYRLREKLKARE